MDNGQIIYKNRTLGNSLAVLWLGLGILTAGALGSIPGQGTKIPQTVWCGQKPPQKTKNKQTKEL